MSLYKKILLFIIIFIFCPHHLDKDHTPRLIVWNVGQGQWLTYIKNNFCYHMDAGGEHSPVRQITKACKHKFNWFYISHADKDHINFYKRFTQKVKHHCLVNPNDNFLKYYDLKRNKTSLCPHTSNSPIKVLYKPQFKLVENKNKLSKVFVIEDLILNPGDSLKENEVYWAKKSELKNITILILGHHGSLTSNSDFLLNKLPNLKYSVASARKKRYGHPHGRIQLRLNANKTPFISTEHWSHITIHL